MNIELKQKQEQLEEVRIRLATEANSIKQLFANSARANADYESAKNQTLIELYAEESEPGFIGKRTEKIREAIYRQLHKDLRFNRDLMRNEVESTKSYIQLLGLMQSNLQSQIKLEVGEGNQRQQ
jgi:hypothetical protein